MALEPEEEENGKSFSYRQNHPSSPALSHCTPPAPAPAPDRRPTQTTRH